LQAGKALSLVMQICSQRVQSSPRFPTIIAQVCRKVIYQYLGLSFNGSDYFLQGKVRGR
jgi:hypothetical protein